MNVINIIGDRFAAAMLNELANESLYNAARQTRDGGFYWKPKTGQYPGFLRHGHLYFKSVGTKTPSANRLNKLALRCTLGNQLTPQQLAPFYELALFGVKTPKK